VTGDCPTCGEWARPGHRCDPIFLVWCPDQGGTEADAEKIRAWDTAEAAEKWAEWSDRNSADYTIVRGSDATVFVKTLGVDFRGGDGEIAKLAVSGEAVPSYTAREAK
jgi:hypothetical protein